jgi:hypothetical protein
MPLHNVPDHGHNPDQHEVDPSLGFEGSDANVNGIVVFLVSLGIFAAVSTFLCYGIGKAINSYLTRDDLQAYGPISKWTKTENIRQLGNMPSAPEMQNKVAQLTQDFPTPRLQVDDGNQDVADLHGREDLLLNNYTWIDQSKGSVRIPIERAMELLAQHGLPVAPAAQVQPAMAGDERPAVVMPLTNGMAPTAFEQEQAQEAAKAEQAEQAAQK